MAGRLGLYELLAPQFLIGFTFPEHIDRYLSTLGVDELRVAHDEQAVVFSGRCSFVDDGNASPVREHRDPGGAVLRWEDVTLDFRMTIPRDGALFVDEAVSHRQLGSQELDELFDAFGGVEGLTTTDPTATDYPGIRFRLELLVSTLTFHLGDSWLPATLDVDHRMIPDPARMSNDVKFVLPKVLLIYEQGDGFETPTFKMASWGSGGFDAPHDLAVGEVVRMEPELAVHRSGRVGFGVGQVVLDLSEDSTPPEILEFFGTDEAFQGVYVSSARVFWVDKDKDFSFNIGVKDVLVSFAGEVSLEASLDVIGPEAEVNVSVHLFQGRREVIYVKGIGVRSAASTFLQTGVVQVRIAGGIPPFTVSVRLDNEELWDAASRQAPISPDADGNLRAPGLVTLHVTVRDSEPDVPSTLIYEEYIELLIVPDIASGAVEDGAAADRALVASTAPRATFAVTAQPPAGFGITCTPAASGITERIVVTGGRGATVTARNQTHAVDATGSFSLDVPENDNVNLVVTWPPSPAVRTTFRLQFEVDRPDPDLSQAGFAPVLTAYAQGVESPPDVPFSGSRAPDGPANPMGAAGLRAWVQNRKVAGTNLALDAHSSFEDAANASRDQVISQRRLEVAQKILSTVQPPPGVDHATAHGHAAAAAANRHGHAADRVVLVEATTSPATAGATAKAEIKRGAAPATPPPAALVPVPAATPDPNRHPPIFRKASARVRLERNVLVLAEISGQLDLETPLEKALRKPNSTEALELKATGAATPNPNPENGVVDFLLNVTYDTATHQLSEKIVLGASPDDINGLLRMTNPEKSTLKDIFGAVLVLAPVIYDAAVALAPDLAGDWVTVSFGLGVPIAIASADWFQTQSVTLYGGELSARQYVPPGEELTFTDAGIIFDYGVEFGLTIEVLGIKTIKPLKVRYKAVGFNLHFADGVTYQPIFDPGRGYELDLSDPGLFAVKPPLDEILRILSVRIARQNPLTLELDLGTKVDLGVVTVDRFKVKWPIADPFGPPQILPTGLKVDIAGVLVGSGYVNISDTGFKGTADVSLVALKLRIAASVGIDKLTDGSRKVVAVFAGLIVEFPAPVPLGNSGAALFGFSGLFAMHYMRDELARDPGSAVSPALAWLVRAKGKPAQLEVEGDEIWKPAIDRWSFGVGVILGSTDGGFVVNLRGMLVLELPGRRILIFVKVQIIAPLPKLGDEHLTVGLLGVVDLNFSAMTLTIGVIADIAVAEIVKVTIPTELFVKLDNPRIWHLYVGTHRGPVSALILNLVRASGYFMIEGDKILDWPGTSPPRTLTGLALATGLEASITLGSVPARLYLRVAAGAHLGISFSPVLFVAGRIYLAGELRLFVVSIEARGELSAQAQVSSAAKRHVTGRICGKVSFFFFKVEGCVGFTIGSALTPPDPGNLVRGVFLQSHAPVLSAGQGGDRPIDASLGNAVALPVQPTDVLPVVPIDTVLVVQLAASPVVSGMPPANTFTKPLVTSPQQTADGSISLGGDRRARYALTSLTLSPPLAGSPVPKPPATWRTERPPDPLSADTNIDLALMSRVPTVAGRALERSTDLHARVSYRWEGMCRPVAPATCVLYTFCGQQLGQSGAGWQLLGTPLPDPPGSSRSQPPTTVLGVEEPETNAKDRLTEMLLADAGLGITAPAEVIGPNVVDPGPPPGPTLTCIRFATVSPTPGPNPLVQPGARFLVRGATGEPGAGTRVVMVAAFTGLELGTRTEITLDSPTPVVELLLGQFEAGARVVALDQGLRPVATAVVPAQPTQLQSVKLTTTALPITRLFIDAPRAGTILASICFVPGPVGVPTPGGGSPALTGDARLDRLISGYVERDQLARARSASEAEVGHASQALQPAGGLASQAGTGVVAGGPVAGGPVSGGPAPTPGPSLPGSSVADRRCHRGLKLPQRSATERPNPLPLTAALKQAAAKRQSDQWVTLRTGRARQVRMFLALAPSLNSPNGLRVRQLNAAGAVLDDKPVTAHAIAPVTAVIAGLPTNWLDAAGPWRAHVLPVATYFATSLPGLTRLLVTITPHRDADRIQLLIPATDKPVRPPAAVVGVVEVCPADDAERQATDEAVKQGQIETLTGYLNGGSVVPLLSPGTTYTLSIGYTVAGATRTQKFSFKTDSKPPARLDPWVLGNTPDDGERYHFTDDPVKLVFNDESVVQLYAAYGKQLMFVLRRADGVPIDPHQLTLDPAQAVVADLTTPYRDFVEAMVAAGKLPCAGTITPEHHGSWTSPVPLDPLMDYVLDVEVSPAEPAGDEATTPLCRKAFTTSQFANVTHLVEDLRRRRVRHRALTGPLAGLPTSGPDVVATDEAIQAALTAAGEQALPAPEESGIVVYWAPRPAGGRGVPRYAPVALLFDAAEPLWRTRQEPVLETVPGQLDPAYQRIVPMTVAALRLVETGSDAVSTFVHSPAGTRTLALIGGTLPINGPITIAAERTASALYGLAAQTVQVIKLDVGIGAPWESDDA